MGISDNDWVAQGSTYRLSALLRDDSLLLHVALVAQDHLLHILIGVLVNIPQPFDDILEALLVRNVVDQHNAHGSSVVRRGDRVEALQGYRMY